jgi:hypothetical protein
MTTIPFNAHRLVRTLKEPGVHESQAKMIGIVAGLVKLL